MMSNTLNTPAGTKGEYVSPQAASISVLMAAYNGSRYIRRQLDSLLGQTVTGFRIFIQDDCSTDGTWDILAEYEQAYPGRFIITRTKKNTGSPKFNFIQLMINTRDDYLFLSDQDDIWLPDKVEKTLARVMELERQYGRGTPILVHSDLTVVNEQLDTISPPFGRP